MNAIEVLLNVVNAKNLLGLVMNFIESWEDEEGYDFEDIRFAIETAHAELVKAEQKINTGKAE